MFVDGNSGGAEGEMDPKSGIHLKVKLVFEPKPSIVIVEKSEWCDVNIPGFRTREVRVWLPVLPFLSVTLHKLLSI